MAFLGDNSLSVVVSTASGELTGEDVAKITDIAMTETLLRRLLEQGDGAVPGLLAGEAGGGGGGGDRGNLPQCAWR